MVKEETKIENEEFDQADGIVVLPIKGVGPGSDDFEKP